MTKVERIKPVKPNFNLPWERGLEHIEQEGSPIGLMREERGWTKGDIYELSGFELHPAQQELYEDLPGLPSLDDLVRYARVFGFSPGELLDKLFRREAERLDESNAGGIRIRGAGDAKIELRAIGAWDGWWKVQSRVLSPAAETWGTMPRRFDSMEAAIKFMDEEYDIADWHESE